MRGGRGHPRGRAAGCGREILDLAARRDRAAPQVSGVVAAIKALDRRLRGELKDAPFAVDPGHNIAAKFPKCGWADVLGRAQDDFAAEWATLGNRSDLAKHGLYLVNNCEFQDHPAEPFGRITTEAGERKGPVQWCTYGRPPADRSRTLPGSTPVGRSGRCRSRTRRRTVARPSTRPSRTSEAALWTRRRRGGPAGGTPGRVVEAEWAKTFVLKIRSCCLNGNAPPRGSKKNRRRNGSPRPHFRPGDS